jgi:hypothetical protein
VWQHRAGGGSLENPSHNPSLNLWMANPPVSGISDGLSVLVPDEADGGFDGSGASQKSGLRIGLKSGQNPLSDNDLLKILWDFSAFCLIRPN